MVVPVHHLKIHLGRLGLPSFHVLTNRAPFVVLQYLCLDRDTIPQLHLLLFGLYNRAYHLRS